MKTDFVQAMRQATLATRSLDLAKATKIIQDALAGRGSNGADERSVDPRQERKTEPYGAPPDAPDPASRLAADRRDASAADGPSRKRWPLGEVVRLLRGARNTPPDPAPSLAPGPPTSEGAQFVTRSFACPAGARRYKLYIPGSAIEARGLIVMLHGCKQDPDDFATGTAMNAIAEASGLMVAYPAQSRSANVSHCWNWFNPADQQRDAGEPAILAGITREVIAEFRLDRRRVYVAGLSAGGAMAAVLGETYPDLYAAVGIHSGLAYQAANDVMSAFAAMKGHAGLSPPARRSSALQPRPLVRAIVFHGDQDRTVDPANADRVVDAALARGEAEPERRERVGVEGGRRCTTTVFYGQHGVPVVELWRIGGAGHAWSGGNPQGSFTDSGGPKASEEMVRFFLQDGAIR